ncbi:MAG: hypothetical protein J0I06_25020 [Planctomycetes bacterium]|nr:hypothetical protein [Planctomycetota bacterium]
MADSKAEDRLYRFGRWLGHWFSRPAGKLALTALLWLLLAGCVQWDEHVRANGAKSLPMAPTRAELLLSLQFGAAIGLLTLLGDVLYSLGLACARLVRASQEPEWSERPRVNAGAVWVTSWNILCIVLVFALGWWCVLHQVFPPLAWIATLAVVIPGALLLDSIFGAGRPNGPARAAPPAN